MLIRLLYYLPMERMIESRDIKHMACVERIKHLEEENKKLKEERDFFYKSAKQFREENEKLKMENKKLKHENSYRAGIVDILPKGKGHIAEETIQDLQARIKELREELKRYKKLHKYSNGELQTYSGD